MGVREIGHDGIAVAEHPLGEDAGRSSETTIGTSSAEDRPGLLEVALIELAVGDHRP
jgi:hypothetical protein